ncbi:MAG: T9SS type A sorting domain-containing protein, partial [candidate division WOR-3 bacterium]
HGNPLWHDTVGTTMSDPTCADLNRDGKMEILIGPTLRSGNFYWFQVDTTAVPVAASPWPTLQHDIWRTGWFGWTPPVGVRTPTGLPVRHSEALLATPNPFTRQVTICARSGKRLSVFDPAGRKVTELNLSGGSTTWDASRLTPGIYFGRLENGAALRLVKLGE